MATAAPVAPFRTWCPLRGAAGQTQPDRWRQERGYHTLGSWHHASDNPLEKLSLADAYNGIGWCWLQLDDCKQDVPYLERALELAPTLAGAKEGLSLCVPNSS
jgi:hypothetical protein